MARLETYGVKSDSAIGKGTFSSVFKVIDLATGKKYAFKQFNKEGSGNEVSIFAVREISILRSLRHPNIISMIDVCGMSIENHSEMGLLLELAVMTLDDQMREENKGHVVIDRRSRNPRYIGQLSGALAYLHSNGIGHRDLKPANILCFPNYVVKICDLGSARAKLMAGGPLTGNVQTLYWRAPELALGAPTYGLEVDIYSLGIIFAQLFLNRCPIIVPDESVATLSRLQFRTLDGMTLEEWPELRSLPDFKEEYLALRTKHPRTWQTIFNNGTTASLPVSAGVVDLISKMTYGNPAARLTAAQVVEIAGQWPEVKAEIPAAVHDNRFDYNWSRFRLKVSGDKRLRSHLDELLRQAYDLILCICIKSDCTNNFPYAKELLRRYVTAIFELDPEVQVMSFSEETVECLACAALVIASKLHDILYVNSTVAIHQLIELIDKGLGGIDVRVGDYFMDRNIDRLIDDVRKAERSILRVLDFDLLFPSHIEIEENYIRNEEDFNAIPFGEEGVHDFHSKLNAHQDFISIVYGLVAIVGVIGSDSFNLAESVRLSLYLSLKIFNRRVKAVFSLQDIEAIKSQWSSYSDILLQSPYPTGCKVVLSRSKVSIALEAAKQLKLL